MTATAKQITITGLVGVCTLIALILGGWLFTDTYFAHAGDVTDLVNAQSLTINATVNDNKLEDKRAQLDALRARQRAGYTYPEDDDLEARLLDDIARAQDYEDKLKVLSTQVK